MSVDGADALTVRQYQRCTGCTYVLPIKTYILRKPGRCSR